MKKVPVLIAGGGPVGLSMSLALARQGVANVLVERNETTVKYPRTRGVSARTMELFHQWGNSTQLLEHERLKDARRFIWTPSLQAKELTQTRVLDADLLDLSPMQSSFVTQNYVEESLLATLKQRPEAEVLFSHELEAFEQDSQGVIATLKNGEQIHCQYFIAADGAHSKVRQKLGIAMKGEENLGEFCSVYCKLDLDEWTSHRPSFGYFFTKPTYAGRLLLAADRPNRWVFFMRLYPSETAEKYSDAHCISEIRRICELPELPVEIIQKSFWKMGAQAAEQYRQGRVFLVGDAAHRIPPTGGLGMNTGIQDAHNLAWKLAHVLQGKATDALLDTYFDEREPVAWRNLLWSSDNARRYVQVAHAIMADDEEQLKLKIAEHHHNLNFYGLDLGFIYHSRAILSEHEQDISITSDIYVPTTLPGSRAPHIWLKNGSDEFSSLDLFEKEYVLLTASQKWKEHAQKSGILCFRIGQGGDFEAVQNDFSKLFEIGETGAVLVRPDGHVCWRSMQEPEFTSIDSGRVVDLGNPNIQKFFRFERDKY